MYCCWEVVQDSYFTVHTYSIVTILILFPQDAFAVPPLLQNSAVCALRMKAPATAKKDTHRQGAPVARRSRFRSERFHQSPPLPARPAPLNATEKPLCAAGVVTGMAVAYLRVSGPLGRLRACTFNLTQRLWPQHSGLSYNTHYKATLFRAVGPGRRGFAVGQVSPCVPFIRRFLSLMFRCRGFRKFAGQKPAPAMAGDLGPTQ
ncbi:Hypothetical protein ETA_pET460020 (plasmid) [Erwinia tasmaniensis Et1/99]|uniref:Uncharacterized protein n=1 Tax=Erwinia tasmaniensis (strain DSM 17950 / CFBP 7177 / CIP 109463 / NCPPB 4357 / Et1/99) TaxID=465817 RepID=B2VB96_ERWT9|nr:Hypothetical protein ETA_pET460020 [Erwinia tasmaniensis Et1/99]